MEQNPYSMIVHETVAEFFPDNPPQFFKAPFSFADVDVLRNLLMANGFNQIEIRSVPKECVSSTARALAIGMIEGAPILAEIQARGGPTEPIVDGSDGSLRSNGRRCTVPLNHASHCRDGTREGLTPLNY